MWSNSLVRAAAINTDLWMKNDCVFNFVAAEHREQDFIFSTVISVHLHSLCAPDMSLVSKIFFIYLARNRIG